MNDRKHQVLVEVQQALLGEVSARLRAVTVSFDDTSLHIDCYYDGIISDSDQEAMSCVETEVMAVFPSTHSVTLCVHRLDFPAMIPKDKLWAYMRNENI